MGGKDDHLIGQLDGLVSGYIPASSVNTLSDPQYKARVDSAVRLRQGPSQESATLATLVKGASVEVLLRADKWTQVIFKDQRGWVMSRFLKFPD